MEHVRKSNAYLFFIDDTVPVVCEEKGTGVPFLTICVMRSNSFSFLADMLVVIN